MKIQRNDPCPCGSGKKYKKCCLSSAEANDFEYRRQRNVEADLIGRLTEYAVGLHGFEGFADAWYEFNGTNEIEMIAGDSPMMMVFMPWFLFRWRFEAIPEGASQLEPTTNAQSFYEMYQAELNIDELRFYVSALVAVYSLYEVIELKPGIGMDLRDLFTGEELEITERAATQTLEPGHILYCAPMRIGNVVSNLGTGPYPLRPTAKHEVLELRKELLKEIGKKRFTKDNLIDFEEDIRDLYLFKVEQMLAPPRLVNSDKDPMLFQKIYYDLKSVDQAFHLLKDLAEDVPEEYLLTDAERENDELVSVEIPWLGGTKKARQQHGGPIQLGFLKLTPNRLIVEVNSTRRANKIKKIIEKKLGDLASYKSTAITPLEGAIEEMWEAAKAGGGVPGPAANSSIDSSDPQWLALMEQAAKDHWTSWYNIPIPALNHMTPREASKSAAGKDLLNSLLLEYEMNNKRDPESPMVADIPTLRRELGMT